MKSLISDLLKSIQELQDIKDLLDDIVVYHDPYSNKIEFPDDDIGEYVPYSLRRRINNYTKFDDSE